MANLFRSFRTGLIPVRSKIFLKNCILGKHFKPKIHVQDQIFHLGNGRQNRLYWLLNFKYFIQLFFLIKYLKKVNYKLYIKSKAGTNNLYLKNVVFKIKFEYCIVTNLILLRQVKVLVKHIRVKRV
jgi:alpha-D-ribose 1-methylphosphonate 5-phosphate C-P lyase